MDTCKPKQCSCDQSFAIERSNPKPQTKYWVAALVQMNTEKRVSSLLGKLGYHSYVPTQTEIHQWSDRKKKIDRIVIPMIVFVHINKDEEHKLRNYSFIYKFLSYPGEKESAMIPDEQIEKLKFMLNNADSVIEFSEQVYEIGDEVEIVRGPLKGLYGELCYTEKGKPMVGVHVKLLGYSLVNVDIKDVQRRSC
jgi:transcription antitermination factor NusG